MTSLIHAMNTIIKKPLSALFAAACMLQAHAKNPLVIIGSTEKGIYTSTLDNETGTLTKPKLAAEIKGAGFLVVHPDKKLLYTTIVIKKGVKGVAAYSINDDGSLNALSNQSSPGNGLCHVSLDATSRALMGANYGDGNVVSFPIAADGTLGKLASLQQHQGSSINPKRQTKPHAHSIYSGPDNRFAYAPDLGIDKVMIYSLDPKTALLTPVQPTAFAKLPAGSGPRHMKFGKNGKFAYVLNELSVSVSVFDRNPSSGMLTPVQEISTLPKASDKKDMSCSEIRISHDGRFIYCANRDLTQQGRDSLSVFAVAPQGKMTLLQTIGAKVWIPRNINLSPSGKWLLVAGQKSNNVTVFKINTETGKLNFSGHEISIPKAMCIEFK